MPVILGILGLLAAAYFWATRIRDAGHMAGDLADMAGDVRAAARRFGFSRRANVHPAESVEDPNIAAASLALAYVSLDGLPSSDDQTRVHVQLRRVLQVDDETAQELVIMGRWLVDQCNGPQPAMSRMARKLYRLEGAQALGPVESILQNLATTPSVHQEEALHEVRTVLRAR